MAGLGPLALNKTNDSLTKAVACLEDSVSVKSLLLLFAVLLALAILGGVSFASTPVCYVPPASMVSWWTGDSDESDLYGVNNPTAVNAVTLVPGKVSNGFTFGTDGYVEIADSSSLDNQKFTWAAWVEPQGPGPNDDQYGSIIVEKGIDYTHGSLDLLWRDNPDDRFVYITDDQFSQTIYSNDTFPPGAFYLVAVSYDGSTFKLYVNGVLEGSLAQKTTITYTPAHTWQIGTTDAIYRAAGFPRTFNGIIDEVQAYKGALSAGAINAIYKAGPAGVCKAPVVVTPARDTFAAQAVGTTSLPKTISILNNRDAGITLTGVSFAGADPADFGQASSTCGSSLAPRKTCKVGVTFTPQATGTRTATLDVNDTASGSPQTVNLAGTGK